MPSQRGSCQTVALEFQFVYHHPAYFCDWFSRLFYQEEQQPGGNWGQDWAGSLLCQAQGLTVKELPGL